MFLVPPSGKFPLSFPNFHILNSFVDYKPVILQNVPQFWLTDIFSWQEQDIRSSNSTLRYILKRITNRWPNKYMHSTIHNSWQVETTQMSSNGWIDKQKMLNMCAVLSGFTHVWLLATLWTVTCQALLSKGFSRQEYWSGLPCPPPGDLPDPGIEPTSLYTSFIGRWVLYHYHHLKSPGIYICGILKTWCETEGESESEEKWCKWTYSQNRKKPYGYQRGKGRRINWEIGIDLYILLYIK